jgi:hypothetical protein
MKAVAAASPSMSCDFHLIGSDGRIGSDRFSVDRNTDGRSVSIILLMCCMIDWVISSLSADDGIQWFLYFPRSTRLNFEGLAILDCADSAPVVKIYTHITNFRFRYFFNMGTKKKEWGIFFENPHHIISLSLRRGNCIVKHCYRLGWYYLRNAMAKGLCSV